MSEIWLKLSYPTYFLCSKCKKAWISKKIEKCFLFFHSGSVRKFPNASRPETVPNAGTKSGQRRGWSQMLGTGNFPDFSGKYAVPGKCHSEMQTSTRHSQNKEIQQYETNMKHADSSHIFTQQVWSPLLKMSMPSP